MLVYYSKGTKISIINNIVYIQELDKIQWIKRTYNGDGKNDVSILYNPIIKAIEWYILENRLEDQFVYIKNIIIHAIFGLEQLQETYGDGNVILAIKFLKNNLKMCLTENFTIELFKDFNEIRENNNSINYVPIKNLWNSENIKLVSNHFDLLDKNMKEQSDMSCLLKSLKSQLMDTDLKFQELVKSINTSL
jgi:hypothetical protein